MTPQTLLKKITQLGLILMMGGSMSGCSSDRSWKEEVQLSDGRVIVVERGLLTEAGGDEWALNRSGSKPKEYRIRFEYPVGSGKMVEWRTTKIDFQTWPEVPLILDVVSDQPIVFAIVAISSGCEVYSKYVYRNGAWIEEPLPAQFEQYKTNLLFGSQKNLPSLVNLEEKNKRNSGVGYRKALKQVGSNLKVCG